LARNYNYLKHSAFLILTSTASTDAYPPSLHDALPISIDEHPALRQVRLVRDGGAAHVGEGAEIADVESVDAGMAKDADAGVNGRREEHTSELQSRGQLVCRLLLEKKKTRRDRAIRMTF